MSGTGSLRSHPSPAAPDGVRHDDDPHKEIVRKLDALVWAKGGGTIFGVPYYFVRARDSFLPILGRP